MRALVLGIALSALAPISAQATFPGQNGKIAFVGYQGGPPQPDIYAVNPDGTGLVQLTNDAATDEDPAWSADGARLAWSTNRDGNHEIYVMNADGTGQTRLTTDPAPDSGPTWSPDGTRIAFDRAAATQSRVDIWMMDSDGSNPVQVTNAGFQEQYVDPGWSPDGARLAFGRFLGVMDPVGSNRTYLPTGDACGHCYPVNSRDRAPDWSPDGTKLVYRWTGTDNEFENPLEQIRGHRLDGNGEYEVAEEGSGLGDPSWSPDGMKVAFMDFGSSQPGEDIGLFTANADGSAATLVPIGTVSPYGDFGARGGVSWQPLPVETLNPHARPKGATPFRVPLVPAYQPCTSPNRQHGPPLAFGSCNPPQPASSNLTIGVGDGSPAFARGEGRLRMDVVIGAPGPPDDSDVNLTFRLTNVMRASDLSEYTGELRTELTVRRTDRDPPGAAPHSTSMDFPFGFTVPCTPTPGSSLDASTCTSFTSANAIVPLAIEDTHRAIWALDKVRVYDGGPDEDAETEAGRSLFMTQGVFVP